MDEYEERKRLRNDPFGTFRYRVRRPPNAPDSLMRGQLQYNSDCPHHYDYCLVSRNFGCNCGKIKPYDPDKVKTAKGR